MKTTVLSGGVGGARFLRGVVSVVEADNVTIIGNVGDDIEILGLHVSPDLDSVLYALAGLADDERGWGRAGETWNALETVEATGRRRLVPARRSRPRPAPRADAAPPGRRPALRGHGTARAGPRASECAAPRHGRSAADVRRDPGRHVPVSGVVRRARPSRRGRRAPLHRRRRGAAGAGRARGDRGGRADRDRTEQPVRLDRADPRRRADPRGARAPPRAVCRGEPADRRPGGQGPRRPDARAPRRRHRALPRSRAATPA